MTPPREPDRFEEKARERAETLFVRVMGTMTSNKCIDLIFAALRREREAALNEAARDAETYCPLNASVSALVLAREIAVHIRALASPAAAPATEREPEIVEGCEHNPPHLRMRPPSEPAAPEKALTTDANAELRAVARMGSAPAPLLPRVLAALEDAVTDPGRSFYVSVERERCRALAAELRAYIAEREGGAEAPDPERDRNRHNAMLVGAWRGEFNTLCKALFPGDDGPIGWKHIHAKIAELLAARAATPSTPGDGSAQM